MFLSSLGTEGSRIIVLYLITKLPWPNLLAYSTYFFRVLPVFIVSLQIYGQLFAKVLTLSSSRYWTCLNMAIKFHHAMNFNAVVNSIYSQVCSVLTHVWFYFYKSSFNFSLMLELANTGCRVFKSLLKPLLTY